MTAEAEPKGPSPFAGFLHPCWSQGHPTLGLPANSHLDTVGEKTMGLKTKRTKAKKVMQRGKNIHFLPKWPDFELAARMVTKVQCPGCPHPQDYPPVQQFHLLSVSHSPPASRQHYTGTSEPAEGGLFFNLWTQRTLPLAHGDSRRPPATRPPLQASRTHPAGEGISGATH